MPPKPSLRPDSGKTNGSKPRALKGPTQEEYEGLRKQLVARDANIEYLRNNLDPAEEVIFKLKNGLPVDNSSEELKNMKKEIESLQSKMRSSEYLQGSLRSKCKEQAHEIEELRQRLAGTEEELREEKSVLEGRNKQLEEDIKKQAEENKDLANRNRFETKESNCHEAFTKLEDKDKELKNKGGDYKQLIERKEE
ncbi:hypothetical protein MAR_019162 [Mya arenaria]|uniref:Uncharacterized protein n=1 Tax=Mya arenaria TaxID=6604 RepID=A0ABY7EJL3_MYAAR|nr:hypothetical protein MAR_019162 [Mya arenaria]